MVKENKTCKSVSSFCYLWNLSIIVQLLLSIIICLYWNIFLKIISYKNVFRVYFYIKLIKWYRYYGKDYNKRYFLSLAYFIQMCKQNYENLLFEMRLSFKIYGNNNAIDTKPYLTISLNTIWNNSTSFNLYIQAQTINIYPTSISII